MNRARTRQRAAESAATASTAAALMIGLALVTLVATLAAGITSTFRGAVDDIFTRRLRDHGAEQLLADPDRDAADAAAKAPGVEAVGERRARARRASSASRASSTAVDRRTRPGVRPGVDGGLAADVFATLGDDGAFVDDELREATTTCTSARRSIVDVRERATKLHVRRSRASSTRRRAAPRSARSRSRARSCDRATSPPEEPLLVRADARRRQPTRTRRRSRRRSKDFPNAKAQTRDEFIDNQISGLNAHPEHPLRAARAVGDRQPVRDRQHARADGLRADARARDAARDRDDAAARCGG